MPPIVGNVLLLLIIKFFAIHFLEARPVLEDFEPRNKFIFRRNFITRELYYKNLSRTAEPDPVRRLRLMVGVTQAAASDAGFVEVYRIKVRWLEPDFWWDNFQGQQERRYELRCEAEEEQTGTTHTFVKMNIDHSIMGYDEHFMTRRPLPLLLICGIRCVNGVGLQSQWVWTKAVKLHKLYNRSPWRPNPMFGHLRSRPGPYYGEGENNNGLDAFMPSRRQIMPSPAFDGQMGPSSSSSSESLPPENPQFLIDQRGRNEQQSPLMAHFRRRFPQWEMLKWRNSGDKTGSNRPPSIFGGQTNDGRQFS